MKILFWTERIWPEIGGIETFARQLVPAMQKRGHEMAIISSSPKVTSVENDPEYGFPIWCFPFASPFKSHNLHQIKSIAHQVIQLIVSFQPDLIHLNTMFTSSFYYLRIPQEIRPPTLLTLHSRRAESGTTKNLQNQIIQNVNYIVGVSKATLESYTQIYPAIASHADVIYNSVNVPSNKPKPLLFNQLTLLCLGRLSFEKGFDVALVAFSLVLERYPKAQLIIAGDGEERSALEEQALILGITDSVQFIGYVHHDHIPELINQATIVLMPSRHEQFPLVALEAGLMERPVVVSRVGGLQESVVHRKTGLLVEPTDYNDLAENIMTLIERPDIATLYGKTARMRVKQLFGVSQFIENYERIYYKVAGT